jgi:hypothetical protein
MSPDKNADISSKMFPQDPNISKWIESRGKSIVFNCKNVAQ